MALASETRATGASAAAQAAPAPPGTLRVRLGTLNNLRWLAVAGQASALLFVTVFLNFSFPLVPAATTTALSALLNVFLTIAFPSAKRLTAREATWFLGFDILQLATILYFTGGIENPFALMFLAPVVVAAATLDVANTFFLEGLALAAISFLAQQHMPLPWSPDIPLELPPLYQVGLWGSLVLGIGFSSMYAWRIASEATRMSTALSATQLALAREHRLSSLGALAAAAGHELGTPLATIAVVAHELERELKDNPHVDDFRLLRSEAERCRAILARLSKPEESVLGVVDRLPLGALLDDLAAPHRGVDLAIVVDVQAGTAPKVWRVPEIIHGLGNLLENASDFAAREVRLRARWSEAELTIEVMDDGPGFSAAIFEQIGEPYVTSRPSQSGTQQIVQPVAGSKPEGMGLGFFIAKTLIEQTRGKLSAHNRVGGGAIVTARWPRGAVDGEEPPREEFLL
jgi:two-component system sensor histidine kinase RegB